MSLAIGFASGPAVPYLRHSEKQHKSETRGGPALAIDRFVLSIVAFLAVAGFAIYVMTPEERVRALRPFVRLRDAVTPAVSPVLAGVRWLIVGLFSGNPWAVTGGVMMVGSSC